MHPSNGLKGDTFFNIIFLSFSKYTKFPSYIFLCFPLFSFLSFLYSFIFVTSLLSFIPLFPLFSLLLYFPLISFLVYFPGFFFVPKTWMALSFLMSCSSQAAEGQQLALSFFTSCSSQLVFGKLMANLRLSCEGQPNCPSAFLRLVLHNWFLESWGPT